MDLLRTMKPGIPRQKLYFIAAVFWLIAGGMLLYRSALILRTMHNHLLLKILVSTVAGMLFYRILFSRIVPAHINRISKLKTEKPCIFSFFSLRSYLFMTVMITIGILVRRSGIVLPEYLAIVYLTMAIPLLISAFRFSRHGFSCS